MQTKPLLMCGATLLLLAACNKKLEDASTLRESNTLARKTEIRFAATGSIDIGNTGAAEISAYDEVTRQLYVVNNSSGNNRIDIIDLSNASTPVPAGSITLQAGSGFVNSVAVSHGLLAAAIEAADKTQPGRLAVYRTADHQLLANITTGSLPDMVCFSPDGKYILTANEGEPNNSYTIDPLGSITIVDVANQFAATTATFESFESQKLALQAAGLRIFGPNASLAQDLEPEYIAVSGNSQQAWVSLQENNAIAQIDMVAGRITSIMPLGYKDHSLLPYRMDASDEDGIPGNFLNWPVKGMYQPDAIAANPYNSTPFVYSANEGDARDYNPGLREARRVNALSLDPAAFPNAAFLKANANLGRLNVSQSSGDADGDGDYDELYVFGARSFSIWHGQTGQLVFDSKNELDSLTLVYATGSAYPENRNDDKGAEPEGITIGRVGNTTLLFVGLERADAVVVYNITNPVKPVFVQWLQTGDAPEGVLFIDGSKRPDGKPLLVVSSEEDGLVKVFGLE